jgi:predicted metalloprotease with PDZ domain
MLNAAASGSRSVPAAYVLGLDLRDDGGIADTIEGEIAAKAGIGPGMKVVAVNGRRFSPEILREAIKASKNSSATVDLLVENTDYYKTYKLDYHGGEKYPHLVRDESKPDLLSEILKAK